jgi:hypothetical protein
MFWRGSILQFVHIVQMVIGGIEPLLHASFYGRDQVPDISFITPEGLKIVVDIDFANRRNAVDLILPVQCPENREILDFPPDQFIHQCCI